MSPPTAVAEPAAPRDTSTTPAVSPRDLLQFRAGDKLAAELTHRLEGGLSPSLTIKRDVERYYALLATVRDGLPFEEAEVALIRLVGWDTPGGVGSEIPRLLWAEVADALRRDPGLAESANVNVDALVAKLRDLGAAELYALVEQVECSPHPALLA